MLATLPARAIFSNLTVAKYFDSSQNWLICAGTKPILTPHTRANTRRSARTRRPPGQLRQSHSVIAAGNDVGCHTLTAGQVQAVRPGRAAWRPVLLPAHTGIIGVALGQVPPGEERSHRTPTPWARHLSHRNGRTQNPGRPPPCPRLNGRSLADAVGSRPSFIVRRGGLAWKLKVNCRKYQSW